MAYDLHFPGPAALYSWPSRGTLKGYAADEATVGWTVPHFQDFLRMLRTQIGAKKIHIIAHSMGNRVLEQAFLRDRPTARQGEAEIREVVLAAPDLDAETFRGIAEQFTAHARRVTLYASSKDKALQGSKFLHGNSRLGLSGEQLVVVEGVDTVDASSVGTDFLGHSYYGDWTSILSDLYYLILEGAPPTKRHGLGEKERSGRRYWFFKPARR